MKKERLGSCLASASGARAKRIRIDFLIVAREAAVRVRVGARVLYALYLRRKPSAHRIVDLGAYVAGALFGRARRMLGLGTASAVVSLNRHRARVESAVVL